MFISPNIHWLPTSTGNSVWQFYWQEWNSILSMYFVKIVLALCLCFPLHSYAQDTIIRTSPKMSILDVNGYFDSRNSSDFTLNSFNVLNNRMVYFTFINFNSNGLNADMAGFYSEHHLYRSIKKESIFDFTAQWMALSGEGNDAFRLGFRWRAISSSRAKNNTHHHHIVYNITFHVVQFDAIKQRSPFMSQLEHFYKLSLWNGKFYLSGFADMDLYYKSGIAMRMVTEHQIGIKLHKNIYGVVEGRYNQYQTEKLGVGFGLQYVFSN